MSVHLVPGQDDITIAVGAGGDKTVTVSLKAGTTHVKLKNLDGLQSVLYALEWPPPPPPPQKPVFPADWSKLDPRREVMFPVGTATKLYLRKLTFSRDLNALGDVPVRTQVGETAQKV